MLLNSHIPCFARNVCSPVQSTWGISLGEDKLGARASILNTKVARRATIPPHTFGRMPMHGSACACPKQDGSCTPEQFLCPCIRGSSTPLVWVGVLEFSLYWGGGGGGHYSALAGPPLPKKGVNDGSPRNQPRSIPGFNAEGGVEVGGKRLEGKLDTLDTVLVLLHA